MYMESVSEEKILILISKFVCKSKSGHVSKTKLNIKVSWVAIKQKFGIKRNEPFIKIWKDDKEIIIMQTEKNWIEIKRRVEKILVSGNNGRFSKHLIPDKISKNKC